MNLNLSSGLRTVQNVITANSPVLLVGTAIAGVVGTGILAAKGGYKARGLVDAERMRRVASPEPPFDTFLEYKEEYEQKAPPLVLMEKVKLTWLCYAVPAVTGASTIASVVGLHTIHTKRHAALAGLYAVTTGKLDDYREEAEKLLGEKKTQELNDAIGQKSVTRDPLINHEVIPNEDPEVLSVFKDEWGGRYVRASVPIIDRACYEINLQLIESGEASLNEFYDYLGLPPVQMGTHFGWPAGTKLEPRFSTATLPNGDPIRTFWFNEEPKYDRGIG